MKINFILVGVSLALGALFFSSYQTGTYTTQGNRTGSNGASTGCATCHGSAPSAATNVNIVLKLGAVTVTEYTPGQQYDVMIDASNTGGPHPKFGFQLTCNKQSAPGTSVGVFGTNGNTSVTTKANGTFLEHNTPLNATTTGTNNTYVQNFKWTAPASGTGTVKFYAVLNAVNGNGQDDNGDQWNFGTSVEIPEAQPSSVHNFYNVEKISVYPNPSSGNISVQINDGMSGKISLTVMDLKGRHMMQTEKFLARGQNTISMDMKHFAKGHYILLLHNTKGSASAKITID